MFEYAGDRLNTYATIRFWIFAIAFVILAIRFGWAQEYGRAVFRLNSFSVSSLEDHSTHGVPR